MPKDFLVTAYSTDWWIEFPSGDYLKGVIRSDVHQVEFPFYSKKSGREILCFLRIVMRQINSVITEGEFKLAQDEIRFSRLPEGNDNNDEKFSVTLSALSSTLPPRIFEGLKKFVS